MMYVIAIVGWLVAGWQYRERRRMEECAAGLTDACRTENAKLKLAAQGGSYQDQIAKAMEEEHAITGRDKAADGTGETRV